MEVDQPRNTEQTTLPLPLPPTLENGSPSPPTTPTHGSKSPDGPNQARLLTFLTTARASTKETPATTNGSNATPTIMETTSAPQETIPPQLPEGPPLAADIPSVWDLITGGTDPDDAPSSLPNRRDPLEKYTKGAMPWAQIHRPTSLYDDIDVDTVVKWWSFPGSKLLAIPFDGEVKNPELHEDIKGCILAAVAEITLSTTASVAAPPPSVEAIRNSRTPTSFLIYNISETHHHILLQRRVWTSTNFTFRVAPLEPTCPDFLFTIKGFATLENSTVKETITSIWNDESTAEFIQELIREAPILSHEALQNALPNFIKSMWIIRLDIKTRGNRLSPAFNVYARGALLEDVNIWPKLRHFLAKCKYTNEELGCGHTDTTPYQCGICHSKDHPRGMCPFLLVKGWKGPRQVPQSRNGRVRRAMHAS